MKATGNTNIKIVNIGIYKDTNTKTDAIADISAASTNGFFSALKFNNLSLLTLFTISFYMFI